LNPHRKVDLKIFLPSIETKRKQIEVWR